MWRQQGLGANDANAQDTLAGVVTIPLDLTPLLSVVNEEPRQLAQGLSYVCHILLLQTTAAHDVISYAHLRHDVNSLTSACISDLQPVK